MSGKIFAPLKSNELTGDPSDPANTYGDISSTICGEKRALDINVLKSVDGGTTNTTPAIANVDIILANTEQSFALPSNCTRFLMRSRLTKVLKFSYVSGGTAGDEFITIKKGVTYEDNSFYSSQTVYFQSTDADDVIEIATFV